MCGEDEEVTARVGVRVRVKVKVKVVGLRTDEGGGRVWECKR